MVPAICRALLAFADEDYGTCVQVLAPVLAEVRRDGVVYARAYDIRERSYSTLFTTPPP